MSNSSECDICHTRWLTKHDAVTREQFNCSPCVFTDTQENNTCYTNWEDFIAELDTYLAFTPCKYVGIVVYVCIFVVGIVGNFLVCCSICRNRHMRTVTNMFIFNLALSDFLVILVCLPPTIIEDMWDTWYFGLVMCKLIKFLQRTTVYVSVLTLTAIAVERYYAIVHPLRMKTTGRRARFIILSIWGVAVLVSTPELFRYEVRSLLPPCVTLAMTSCQTPDVHDQLIFQRVTLVLFYIIPAILMSIAYGKIAATLWFKVTDVQITEDESNANVQLVQRRRIAKMLIVVVIMFFVCFLPNHVTNELRYTSIFEGHDELATCLFLVNHVLVYINSSCNPLIYNFMSEKFRCEFRLAFSCCYRSRCRQKTCANHDNEEMDKRQMLMWKRGEMTEHSKPCRTMATQVY